MTDKQEHQKCGILFDNGGIPPGDPHGCLLPHAHTGPHEFLDAHGTRYQWETDWSCTCEHCMEAEGDYCSVYWRV